MSMAVMNKDFHPDSECVDDCKRNKMPLLVVDQLAVFNELPVVGHSQYDQCGG